MKGDTNASTTTQTSPDDEGFNIVLAVFALLLITAIMCGVAVCIIRGNVAKDLQNEIEDIELTEEQTSEKISLTSSRHN